MCWITKGLATLIIQVQISSNKHNKEQYRKNPPKPLNSVARFNPHYIKLSGLRSQVRQQLGNKIIESTIARSSASHHSNESQILEGRNRNAHSCGITDGNRSGDRRSELEAYRKGSRQGEVSPPSRQNRLSQHSQVTPSIYNNIPIGIRSSKYHET
jgi:hypothetical protein